jgi:hypothetical protein
MAENEKDITMNLKAKVDQATFAFASSAVQKLKDDAVKENPADQKARQQAIQNSPAYKRDTELFERFKYEREASEDKAFREFLAQEKAAQAKPGKPSGASESDDGANGIRRLLFSEASAHAVAGLAHGARELADELRRGGQNAAEMASKLLDGIPIVGNFAKAGRDIREIFTGEQAEIDRINKSIEQTNAISDLLMRSAETTHAMYVRSGDELYRIRQEMELIGKKGVDLSRLNLFQGGDADARRRRQELQEEERRIEAENLKDLQEFHAKFKKPIADDTDAKGDYRAKFQTDANGNTYSVRYNKNQAELDQYDNDLAKVIERGQKRISDLHATAGDEMLAADQKQIFAEMQFISETNKAREEAERQHGQAIIRIRGEISDSILKNSGRATEAEHEANKRQLAQDQEDLLQKAQAEIENDVENQDRIIQRLRERSEALRDVAANKDALIQQSSETERVASEQADRDRANTDALASRERQYAIDRELGEFKIKNMEQEAKLGNRLLAFDAERLRIKQDTLQQEKQLKEIIFGADSTDAQRAAARLARAALPGEEARLLARVGLDLSPLKLAGATDSRYTSGLAESQRERYDPTKQVAENTNKAAALLNNIAEGIARLVALMTSPPAKKSILGRG